ncbi:LCD1 DNA damage checkpoint protein LCD1 [Candida maltosa Xu316]
MSNSDTDFDDDDDQLLQDVLYGRTQVPNNTVIANQQQQPPQPPVQSITTTQSKPTILDDKVQARLFQADGEIATLRAQLLQLQNQKQQEITELKQTYDTLKQTSEEQMLNLKNTVQRLEDEKKFLNNELISTTAVKRRKVTTTDTPNTTTFVESHSTPPPPAPVPAQAPPQPQQPPTPNQTEPTQLTTQYDYKPLIDQLWNNSIIGSSRTSFEYLSKICLDFDLELNSGLVILKQTSISSSIVEFLMINKNNRLDKLIEIFTLSLIQLVERLLKQKSILSIPFLLSLIHCSISFRPAALTKALITQLLKRVSKITEGLSFLLNSNLDEDDLANYHDVPYQIMVLEKFIFTSCLDLVERLVTLSTIFDEPQFVKKIWQNHILSESLITSCLPENSERFKNTAQINAVFNIVEMLIASVSETTFGFNETKTDESIISSLLKIFLIEIPLRQDFMFYGLNRILGNNHDFIKVDSVIPVQHDYLNNYLVSIPQPIPYNITEPSQFEINMNHEYHLLTLRIKVAELLLSLIITKQTVDFLYSKDHFKSLIRVIGFEQNYIARSPRSKHIYLRLQIIAILVKIVDYLTQDLREISELMYGELMYEIFVIFSRIAFGSDSLSIDAHKLLVKIRAGGLTPVFNKWCESRARELNHIVPSNNHERGSEIADIESDFANGLEFPYESETVELARDILNRFVDHDEAENLYFSMNPEDGDEEEEEDENMNLAEEYNHPPDIELV